jgi:hypothetical protein
MKSIKERGLAFRDNRLSAVQAHRDEWMRRAVAAEAALAALTNAAEAVGEQWLLGDCSPSAMRELRALVAAQRRATREVPGK